MSKSSSLGPWLKQHYDKAALLGTLIVLLVSAVILLLLAGQSGGARGASAQGPAHAAEVEPLDLAFLDQAIKKLASPTGVSEKPGALTSELRVFCVNCGKAIPFDAPKCVFCDTDQPEPNEDRDGDHMPDEWEIAQEFNPDDPYDAMLDADADGFSNLEEYLAKTDPRQRENAPPIITKLRIDQLRQERFRLRFEAVQTLESGDLYQLNSADRTYFKRLGNEVDGYQLDRYDANSRMLFLKKGDRLIGLPMGKDVIDDLITVGMVFLIDDQKYSIRKDDTFELRGRTYRMTEIRGVGASPTVVIVDTQDQSEYTIQPITQDERSKLEERRRTMLDTSVPGSPAFSTPSSTESVPERGIQPGPSPRR
ncbi:MAG: hypothetical protein KBA51_04545 [Kiritimatiellae bacterium]|nr:hypothetical protein [Kiritimatiellia bacterium]